jgi:hypothetical protein
MLNVYAGAPASNNSVPTVAMVLKLRVVIRAAPNSATELLPEGAWPVDQFDASVQLLEPPLHSPLAHTDAADPEPPCAGWQPLPPP